MHNILTQLESNLNINVSEIFLVVYPQEILVSAIDPQKS